MIAAGETDDFLAPLIAELDAWRRAGRIAGFWWRDDDATAPSDRLDRLLTLCARFGVRPVIAAIPGLASAGLATALRPTGAVVAQHGIAHRNRAPESGKKAELTGADKRNLAAVATDLQAGAARLQRLFADNFKPLLVPPWNRIDTDLVARLPGLGYRGLSTFAPRRSVVPVASPGANLVQVNCHIDPVDWRAEPADARVRPPLAPERVAGMAVAHLQGRRTGRFDPDEPTGLLTHHLIHDEPTWTAIGLLAELAASHDGAAWVDPEQAFALRRRPFAP